MTQISKKSKILDPQISLMDNLAMTLKSYGLSVIKDELQYDDIVAKFYYINPNKKHPLRGVICTTDYYADGGIFLDNSKSFDKMGSCPLRQKLFSITDENKLEFLKTCIKLLATNVGADISNDFSHQGIFMDATYRGSWYGAS